MQERLDSDEERAMLTTWDCVLPWCRGVWAPSAAAPFVGVPLGRRWEGRALEAMFRRLPDGIEAVGC
jgi:hypothetical protein